jgi:cell division protein FtsA
MTMSRRRVGALDLGTAKTLAVIGEVYDDGPVIVLGVGLAETEGVVRGAVSDLDLAAATMGQAVREAEKSAGIPMPPVFLNVTGGHIRSEEGYAADTISGDPPDIKMSDIERLIQKIRNLPVPPEEDMIHLIPNEYALDGISGVHTPLGMAARRLELKACRIFAQHAPLQNLIRSADRAAVEVAGLMVQSLAAGEAVLTEAEKQEGVLLLDLGEGTSDLAFYGHGAVLHASVVPIGGYYFTRDIALGLQISRSEAEQVKKEHGTLLRSPADKPSAIHLPVLGGQETRRISSSTVADILEARMQELCSRLKRNLAQVDMSDLIPRGLVITGGGATLNGIDKYLTREFRLPVRLGRPNYMEQLPERLQGEDAAAVVGLLRYGIRQIISLPAKQKEAEAVRNPSEVNILRGIRRTLQDFFR